MSDMSGQSASGGYRPAGWYYAQGDPPGTHRYWDGSSWQGEPQPVNPTTQYGAQDPTSAQSAAGFGDHQSQSPGTPDSDNAYVTQPEGSPEVFGSVGSPGASASGDVGGFLSTLFDTKFSTFITGRAISVVYILVLIAVTLATLAFVVGGLAGGGASALVALILGPLIGLFYLVMIRMTLEFFVNQFRQTELLEVIAEKLDGDQPG